LREPEADGGGAEIGARGAQLAGELQPILAVGDASAEIELSAGDADPKADARGPLAAEPLERGVERERQLAGQRAPLRAERSARRARVEPAIDLAEGPYPSRLGVTVADRAAFDGDMVELQPGGQRRRNGACGGRIAGVLASCPRAGGRANGGELPVAAPVGKTLEVELRLDEGEALDLDAAREKRGEGNMGFERLEPQQVRARRSGLFCEWHGDHREPRRRQDGERHVALDRERTPGRLLDPASDLALVAIPVDEARGDESGHDEQRHQDAEAGQQMLNVWRLPSSPLNPGQQRKRAALARPADCRKTDAAKTLSPVCGAALAEVGRDAAARRTLVMSALGC